MDRQAEVSIALGGSAKFHLARFTCTERLSEPFVIDVEGFSPDEIDFLPHMGKPVSLDAGDSLDHIRWFHGRLTDVELIKVDVSGLRYRLTLRPWFQLLDQNRDYRIFQNKNVVDIAKKIFTDRGMSDHNFDKLVGSYPKYEYCVQYKESDFHFLSRLFEREGIYYFFEHEKSKHTLVLCDGNAAHRPAPNYESIKLLPTAEGEGLFRDTINEWREKISTASQILVTQRAFDFKDRENIKKAESKVRDQHPGDALELYSYPDDFTEETPPKDRGDIRLAAGRVQRRIFQGVGDVPGLACGGVFTLREAKPDRYNQEYLVTGLKHMFEAEAHRTDDGRTPRRATIEAMPSNIPFRPMPVTPKPYTTGVETATVVGNPSEEVDVDNWGRVRVRFNWDRRDPDPKWDDSIWMRVSHHAAGIKFGNVDLPRVGQEVIVDFLGGDPDHPIITGRVYNNREKHPYDLPTHKTRSVWKTQTIGSSGGDYGGAEFPSQPPNPGFNEIRLEDKSQKEEFYIHAQREMLTVVQRDDELKVNRDRKTRVGRDRTTNIKNNDTETVEEGDFKLFVKKGEAYIEAKKKITLKCGMSTIVLEPEHIKIDSPQITSTATGPHKIKGATVEIDGGGLVNMHAALIKIN